MRKKLLANILSALLLAMAFMLCVCACDNQVDEIKSYRIAFDSQGGSSISSCENTVVTEPIPVKEGYEFCGWYLTDTYEGERLVFPYVVEEDLRVYAKWERTIEGEKNELIQYIKSEGKKDGDKYLITFQTNSANSILEYVFGYNSQSDVFMIYGSYMQLYGSQYQKRVAMYTNLSFTYSQLEKGLSVLDEVSYAYNFSGDFIPTKTNLYTINIVKIQDSKTIQINLTPNSNNEYSDLTQEEETKMLTQIFNYAYEFANTKAKSVGIVLK